LLNLTANNYEHDLNKDIPICIRLPHRLGIWFGKKKIVPVFAKISLGY